MQKKPKNYNSFYLNFYIFGKNAGRHKIMNGMIASITWLQSDLNFFLNFDTSALSKEIFSILYCDLS
jgi:hypothetical protein